MAGTASRRLVLRDLAGKFWLESHQWGSVEYLVRDGQMIPILVDKAAEGNPAAPAPRVGAKCCDLQWPVS